MYVSKYKECQYYRSNIDICVILSTYFLYKKIAEASIEILKIYLPLLILFLLSYQFWHYHNLKHMLRNYKVWNNSQKSYCWTTLQQKCFSAISGELIRMFFWVNWYRGALKHHENSPFQMIFVQATQINQDEFL